MPFRPVKSSILRAAKSAKFKLLKTKQSEEMLIMMLNQCLNVVLRDYWCSRLEFEAFQVFV